MNNSVNLSVLIEYEPFKQMSQSLRRILERKKTLLNSISEWESAEYTKHQNAHWAKVNSIARKQQRIISIIWSVIWIFTLQLIGIMIAVGKETFFEDKCKARSLKINQKEKYKKMELLAIEQDEKETKILQLTAKNKIKEMQQELKELDKEFAIYQKLYDGWKFRGEMAIRDYDLSGDVDDAISWLINTLPRYEGAVLWLEAIDYAWEAFKRKRAEAKENIEKIVSTFGEIYDAMHKGKQL